MRRTESVHALLGSAYATLFSGSVYSVKGFGGSWLVSKAVFCYLREI